MVIEIDKKGISDGEKRSVSKVDVWMGETKYRISESVDGKLTVNKYNPDSCEMNVFPRLSNEIDIL